MTPDYAQEQHDDMAHAPVYGHIEHADGSVTHPDLTDAERTLFDAILQVMSDEGDPDYDEVASLRDEPDQVRAFLAELQSEEIP